MMATESKITFTETCPNCGNTVPTGNFCPVCRCKLHEKCDCWVLGREYDCGCQDCPGEGLYLMLLKRGQHLVESKARVAVCDALSLIPDHFDRKKLMESINSQNRDDRIIGFNQAPKNDLNDLMDVAEREARRKAATETEAEFNARQQEYTWQYMRGACESAMKDAIEKMVDKASYYFLIFVCVVSVLGLIWSICYL